MAIVTIPGGLLFPPIPCFNGIQALMFLGSGGIGTHRASFIFRVPKTGTLDKFEYMGGGSVGSCDAKLSFQDVDVTTGDPDGSIDQYRVIAPVSSSVGWVVPGLMTDNGTDGGNKRSVTRGDWLACVIQFDTFPGGVGFTVDAQTLNANAQNLSGSAYCSLYDGSNWSKTGVGAVPIIALKYDDGNYYHIHPNVYPMSVQTAQTYNTGSSPDEYAMRFQVPFACEVDGCWFRGILGSGGADLVLYDSGSSVLQTISLDKDIVESNSRDTGHWHRFPTVQALSANTTYRLALKPTSGSNTQLQIVTVNAAGHLRAWEGGTECYLSERTDAGAWTDTTTKRPYMGLTLTGVDTSSGGGEHSYVF